MLYKIPVLIILVNSFFGFDVGGRIEYSLWSGDTGIGFYLPQLTLTFMNTEDNWAIRWENNVGARFFKWDSIVVFSTFLKLDYKFLVVGFGQEGFMFLNSTRKDTDFYYSPAIQLGFFWRPENFYGLRLEGILNVPLGFANYFGFNIGLSYAFPTPTKVKKEKMPPIVEKRKEEISPAQYDTSYLSAVLCDVDKLPKFSVKENENIYAIIIGISQYKYAPSSPYSDRDAWWFKEYVKRVFGVPEENIYFKLNGDATKGEFDKILALNGWLAKRIDKGKSRIIFYYSGHGATDPKTRKSYIIPYDIDPKYPTSGVSLEEIYTSLNLLGAKDVIIFIDACFSGQVRGGEKLLVKGRPLGIIPISTEPPPNFVVFFASREDEIAITKDEYKHGLFTYYLLKSFHQKEIIKDKKIYAGEIYRYIKKNVVRDAIKQDMEQTPVFKGDLNKLLIKK